MPILRLTPSSYDLTDSTYMSVSNASDMYSNTDSDDYATVTNNRNSTGSYYIYLRGFNFGAIPDNIKINSFRVLLKARESGVTTSSSYRPVLCSGTSVFSNTYCSAINTTASVHEFEVAQELSEFIAEGEDFGIRINCRRNSRNTISYMYIYGAEIEINYTELVSATVTSSVNGNGSINPSGISNVYVGDEYTITITPADISEAVTATKNGVDISDDIIGHGDTVSTSTNLGTFTLESGSFNGSGDDYFQGIVGNGVNSSTTSSNYYSGNYNSNTVFTYAMNFDIPSNAIIERVYCEVNGHAESSSNSSEYMCVQLKSGGTDLSEQINFKDVSTSNTTVTLECETLPTASQLSNMVLECTLGYYGGAINGATAYVTYSLPSEHPSYYTYTYVVDGDATIVVTIGTTNKLFIKDNGLWKEVGTVYKKINGQWVEQIELESVFNVNTNYVRA